MQCMNFSDSSYNRGQLSHGYVSLTLIMRILVFSGVAVIVMVLKASPRRLGAPSPPCKNGHFRRLGVQSAHLGVRAPLCRLKTP
jgi:hypothetical protein